MATSKIAPLTHAHELASSPSDRSGSAGRANRARRRGETNGCPARSDQPGSEAIEPPLRSRFRRKIRARRQTFSSSRSGTGDVECLALHNKLRVNT